MPSDCEVTLSRAFDPPRPLVFASWTRQDMITQHIRHPSQTARDAAIATGMAEGFAVTLDRLTAVLASG